MLPNTLLITLTMLIAKAGLSEKPKEDAPKPAAAAEDEEDWGDWE